MVEIPTQWDAVTRTYDHKHTCGHTQRHLYCISSTQRRQKAPLHGWIKQKHFVGVNIKAPIFISGPEELS